MNARKISLSIAVLFAGLLMLNGCKKSEPTPTETSSNTMAMEGHEGHDHAAMAEEAAEEVVAAAEQTICPVMGGAINKAVFIEYKGKKVYFCCDPCKDKFKEAPEQYIAKLPQFNQ
ncbi:MAG: YHS domain-containing protein [Planctomycetota bacterium]|jgi:YHS domain-containing protein